MNRAFYYINGEPTNGVWIDLADVSDIDDVTKRLADSGRTSTDGELLVADTDGELAAVFYDKHTDKFDLDTYKEAETYCYTNKVSELAVATFVDWCGSWDESEFEDSYNGEWDSEAEFAKELLNDCGYLRDMPESMRQYFDYAKFAQNLFMSDYYFSNGFVFRSV